MVAQGVEQGLKAAGLVGQRVPRPGLLLAATPFTNQQLSRVMQGAELLSGAYELLSLLAVADGRVGGHDR